MKKNVSEMGRTLAWFSTSFQHVVFKTVLIVLLKNDFNLLIIIVLNSFYSPPKQL